MEDSPMPLASSDRHSSAERNGNSQSLLIQQLTLLYQLEQRKVDKLQNENQSLRERVRNLLNKQDDERIELLVADKTKRKLNQLKAITERTIKSLESGIKEFRAFVDDIDEAVEEQEHSGALKSAKMDGNLSFSNSNIIHTPIQQERLLEKFQPRLKRIPESPMILIESKRTTIPKVSTSRRRAMIHQIEEQALDAVDENETVEETHLFDYQHVESAGYSGGNEMQLSTENNEQQLSIQEEQPNKIKEMDQENNYQDSQIDKQEEKVQEEAKEVQKEAKEVLSDKYNNSNTTINETGVENETTMNTSTVTTASASDVIAGQSRQRRAAVSKVKSYKLPTLNKKMRREV